jgi:hypothetical protein
MKHTIRIFSVFALVAILTLAFAAPAAAFDGRTGDLVVIGADEVIQDDLYVSAREFTSTAQLRTTVGADRESTALEGDLIAGAGHHYQRYRDDDVRIAAALIRLAMRPRSAGPDRPGRKPGSQGRLHNWRELVWLRTGFARRRR